MANLLGRIRTVKLSWSSQAAFIGQTTHEKRRLVVTVAPVGEHWNATALVIPLSHETVDHVLDDHAHKQLGSYASAEKAFAAAEGFARAWRKGFKATSTEKCACPELPTEREG